MAPSAKARRLPTPVRAAVVVTRLMSQVPMLDRPYNMAAYHTGAAVVDALGPGAHGFATLGDGAQVRVPLDDPGFRRLWLGGAYETDVVSFARAVLRPGDVAVDVGANVGVHSLRFAALIGPGGAVHAFEPNVDLITSLKDSIRRNGWEDRVVVHPVALGTQKGSGTLYVNDAIGLLSSTDRPEWLGGATEKRIRIARLDDVASLRERPVRLMKIDVEGAEAAVLSGGSALFEHAPPQHVIAEASSSVDAAPMVDWLIDRGYVPVIVRGNEVVATTSPTPRLPEPTLSGPMDPGFEYCNLMFRHRG